MYVCPHDCTQRRSFLRRQEILHEIRRTEGHDLARKLALRDTPFSRKQRERLDAQ